MGNYFVQCSVASNGQCLSGGGICQLKLGENDGFTSRSGPVFAPAMEDSQPN